MGVQILAIAIETVDISFSNESSLSSLEPSVSLMHTSFDVSNKKILNTLVLQMPRNSD